MSLRSHCWPALFLILSVGAPAFGDNPAPAAPVASDAGDADLQGGTGEIDRAAATINHDDQQLKDTTNPPTPERQAELQKERQQNVDNIVAVGDQHPNSAPVNLKASQALASVNEPQRALPLVDRAVDLAQRSGDPKMLTQAQETRGQINFGMGNYAAAAADAKEILKRDPNNQAALSLYSLTRDRGEINLKAAAKPNPFADQSAAGSSGGKEGQGPRPPQPAPGAGLMTPSAANRLQAASLLQEAQTQAGLGEKAKAKELLDKAVALDPASAKALLQRAKIRQSLKDPAGAAADAGSALSLDATNAEAYALRAQAREGLRISADEVLSDYKTAAALDSTFAPQYEQALARYRGQSGGGLSPAEMASGAAARPGAAPPGSPLGWEAALRGPSRAKALWGAFLLGVLLAAALWWARRRQGDAG